MATSPAFVRGIDVSSAQPIDLSGLIQATAAQHVVVRMYLPWERPSPSISRAQVASAVQNGCSVSPYVWAYSANDPTATVYEGLKLARACGLDSSLLWIDCETYNPTGRQVEDPGPDADWLRRACAECVGDGVRPGIYSARWWWTSQAYMDDSAEFAGLPLWIAQYDSRASLDDVVLFGGWTAASGKQYAGDKPVDLDVFSADVV